MNSTPHGWCVTGLEWSKKHSGVLVSGGLDGKIVVSRFDVGLESQVAASVDYKINALTVLDRNLLSVAVAGTSRQIDILSLDF